MHSLDHRAVLRGHETGRLRAGNAQCVYRAIDIELERPRRTRASRKNAQRRA